jgi:hypothetical protein
VSEENVTYYAITGRGRTVDNPHGIVRRRESAEIGILDEALHKDFYWHRTGIIATWENASFSDELEEVSEEKARQIIENLRAEFE